MQTNDALDPGGLIAPASVATDRPATLGRRRGRRSVREALIIRAVSRALATGAMSGSLRLDLPSGRSKVFTGSRPGPEAHVILRSFKPLWQALRRGALGLVESHIDGAIDTPDLSAVLRFCLANRGAYAAIGGGFLRSRWLGRLWHRQQRNTIDGSRRNIAAHYDLGNAFYSLWLDPTMMYSSAIFDGGAGEPLEVAQLVRLDRIRDALEVAAGDRVLEIGCGWGALAETAAREFGARITGVTLSTEQLAFAQERVARHGVAELCELRLQDYRDISDGPFDAIASIEMFEAVGREYWGGFFATLRDKLKPGGRACIQTITIRDDLFERYVRSTDFIQQYIFPGGLLPSPQAFRAEAQRAGLEVVNELAFGADYAETLRRWREQFMAQDPQVRKLGFDTRFMRIWEFYLAYCEAAFATGNTGVVQFTLRRP